MKRKHLASKPGWLHKILIWACWASIFMAGIFLINFLIDPEAESTRLMEVLFWCGIVVLVFALVVGSVRRK